MYARLTRVYIRRDRIDEAIKRYETSVVPAAKSQKGYCGAYLLIDREIGQGVVITLWNSEEDAVANEKNRYYQEQVAKFINFFAKPPIREGFEVIFKD